MKKSLLTEKNMSNKHFLRTEQAIFIAYCKFKDYPSARKIARHAKISPSTFYRHHQTAISIPRDHEEFLLQNFAHQIEYYLKDNYNLKTVFLRSLAFIANNREVIKGLFADNHKEIIKKMLNQLKIAIIKEWRLDDNLDTVFAIYQNEVLAVIEIWSEQNFSNRYLDQTLNNIMHLTKVARHNLLSLK